MKLITYRTPENRERLGTEIGRKYFDLHRAAARLKLPMPESMNELLDEWEAYRPVLQRIQSALQSGEIPSTEKIGQELMALLAPVPKPPSCRDAYTFRQHVEAARRNRGVPMVPEFDQFPIFYYTNHNAIYGEGAIAVEKDHLEELDFELEVAVVIGKSGKNILAEDADSYIAGFTIMNDFSARRLQREEMLLSLGPAKGKDFATALGPFLVTPDELEKYRIPSADGDRYDLRMSAYHNEKRVSDGNLKDMTWTFAQVIERVSYGTDIFPGDVIGSGTVGTGCYMELNGTAATAAKEKGEPFSPVWLKDGDTIELEVEGLGRLRNEIRLNPGGHSILAKKRMPAE